MHGPQEIEVVVRRRRVNLAPILPPPPKIDMPTRTLTPMSEVNIVAQATTVLGRRIGSLRGIRLLDGTPCDLDRLMKEANKLLAAEDMPQLGRNPEWRV